MGDLQFLEQHNIMDYSLLVGIAETSETPLITRRDASIFRRDGVLAGPAGGGFRGTVKRSGYQ